MKTLLTTTALVLSAVSAMAIDFTPETRVANSDTISGFELGFDAIYAADGSLSTPSDITNMFTQLDILWNTSTEGSMTVASKSDGSSDQADNGTVVVIGASVSQSTVGDGEFIYDQAAINAAIATAATAIRTDLYGADISFVAWDDADGAGHGIVGEKLVIVKGIYESIDNFANLLETNFSTHVWNLFDSEVSQLQPAVMEYNNLQTLAYNQLTAFDGLRDGNAGNE